MDSSRYYHTSGERRPKKMSVREASRWQQERERFQLTDEEPPAPESITDIQQALLDFFARMKAPAPTLLRQIAREWEETAGETIARHTQPVSLEKEKLLIAVDSTVWMNELARFEKAALQARLQKKYGVSCIKALAFKVDPTLRGSK